MSGVWGFASLSLGCPGQCAEEETGAWSWRAAAGVCIPEHGPCLGPGVPGSWCAYGRGRRRPPGRILRPQRPAAGIPRGWDGQGGEEGAAVVDFLGGLLCFLRSVLWWWFPFTNGEKNSPF